MRAHIQSRMATWLSPAVGNKHLFGCISSSTLHAKTCQEKQINDNVVIQCRMVIQICEMCTGVRNMMCCTEQSGVLERERERAREITLLHLLGGAALHTLCVCFQLLRRNSCSLRYCSHSPGRRRLVCRWQAVTSRRHIKTLPPPPARL